MQIIDIHTVINSFLAGFLPSWELRGVLAAEAIKLILLPFHEFSIASCIVAFGWIMIFWKNKGLLLSGLSHILNINMVLAGFLRKLLVLVKL